MVNNVMVNPILSEISHELKKLFSVLLLVTHLFSKFETYMFYK